jgi:signal-transduction protein with cAMP-binding, CBS, and nucleotidyltransferase domain
VSTPDVAEFLRDVRIFQAFSDADRAAVDRALRERTLRKGHVLFREGDPGEEMFLVRRGHIVVSKAVTGPVEQVLARMGPGDFFGEMSLFDRAPRSATIQADPASDVALLVLDRASLEAMLMRRGEVEVIERDYKRYVGAQIGIYNPRGEKVGKVSHLRNTEFVFVVRDARGVQVTLDCSVTP